MPRPRGLGWYTQLTGLINIFPEGSYLPQVAVYEIGVTLF